MNLTIHRGTHEIGGSCIELAAGKSRILLDFGMPLFGGSQDIPFDEKVLEGKTVSELKKLGILPDIKGLYKGEEKGIEGIFISHSHLDHYGFLQYINPDIPVYMSHGTKGTIEISNIFLSKKVFGLNIITLESWKPFKTGGFKVTPHLADHSAFDAFSYLVQSGRKKLFYSGDFRGTGRKYVLFDNIIKKAPRNIDCLLMEGSMMGRGEHLYGNELAVEEGIKKSLKESSNITFLFCSSQNIDRLVSAYKACIVTGKTFVIDLYSAMILKHAGRVSKNIPQYNWNNVRVNYYKKQADSLVEAGLRDFLYEVKSSKIDKDEIVRDKNKILLLARDNSIFKDILGRISNLEGSKVIYSMWEGYLTEKFLEYCDGKGISIEKIHTSGHANFDHLRQFARAFKPKMLVPVHTFEPERFSEFYDKVKMLDDGEMHRV